MNATPTSTLKVVLSALLLIAVSAFGLGAGASAYAPTRVDVLAAVFPPWWPAARSFTAAASAGAVLRMGASPTVLVVRSERSGLAERLKSAGALFLFDPQALGLCGATSRGLGHV